MTWIILLWIFQGYSLFSYQCSLLFSATLISYHIQRCLSTTFSFFFFNSFELMCCRFRQLWYFIKCLSLCQELFSFFILNVSALCDSLIILSNHQSFVNNFFQKNSNNSYFKSERRKRDLNPRAGYPTYTLSRGTSSATWVFLQSSLFDNMMLFEAYVTHIWYY